MNISGFTVDEAQELIALGDHKRHQQVWVERDGEVRIADPSGLKPTEAASTLYARSQIFCPTENEETAYVGRYAANDPKLIELVIRGLLEAQVHFSACKPIPVSSEFWI